MERKRKGEERIQQAHKNQDKDVRANLIFWYYYHKIPERKYETNQLF